jgi:hypothetical protein
VLLLLARPAQRQRQRQRQRQCQTQSVDAGIARTPSMCAQHHGPAALVLLTPLLLQPLQQQCCCSRCFCLCNRAVDLSWMISVVSQSLFPQRPSHLCNLQDAAGTRSTTPGVTMQRDVPRLTGLPKPNQSKTQCMIQPCYWWPTNSSGCSLLHQPLI